jgi:Domain of unknown function (DUF5076)
MSKFELLVPPGAASRKDSREILRAWRVGDGLHCSLAPDAWEEPAAWGLALADIAQHVATALQETTGVSPEDTLDAIRYMFNAELLGPTGKPSGGFV